MGERVLLRGPKAHSVTWTIDEGWIQGAATCHATEGADCRMVCPEGCESWSLTDHEHQLVDGGECNFVQWIEAEGLQEAHAGRTESLRDGFIDPEWSDDHYVWRYSDAP